MKAAITVVSLCVSMNVLACKSTDANYNPNPCVGNNNGVFDCTGGPGGRDLPANQQGRTSSPLLQNPGNIRDVNLWVMRSPQQDTNANTRDVNLPTDGYRVSSSGDAPGVFDFRSSSMIQRNNGTFSSGRGRCPAVMRDGFIVYYDCRSTALTRAAERN